MPQDFARAAKLYEEAVREGFYEAAYKLALIYGNERTGLANKEKFLHYIQIASDHGMPEAMSRLAVYHHNNGNYDKAFEFSKKAAERGNPDGLFNLGYCYETGIHTPKDIQEAVKWYQKAEEKNNPRAAWRLYHIFENGKDGIEVKPRLAIVYLTSAAKGGIPEAKEEAERKGLVIN